MKAHLQDLARSIGCRGLREIQLTKLHLAQEERSFDENDVEALKAAIEDELPGEGRLSHFEIRLQMFDDLGYSREELETVEPLPESTEATALFRSIFVDRSLLEITAAVGAIEQWYVPVAALLEKIYLGMGYSGFQVATYTLHKSADVHHSHAALSFVDKYAEPSDLDLIIDAVDAGFRSVRRYDDGRYAAAVDHTRSIADYLRLS